jgi:predicted dehydrogenase
MAGSYGEVLSLVETAKKNGVYLHEGIVPLFSENFKIIKESLPLVGRVREVNINMSQYSTRYDAYLRGEEPTTFRRELCNGAVMDLGVYLLALCVALFGEPKSTHSASVMLDSGVDASTSMLLCYGDFIANLVCSKVCDTENKFEICGENGTLMIDHPTKYTSIVYKSKKNGVRKELASESDNLFYYEIREMIDRINSGNTQSVSAPLELSLTLHKLLTEIRKNTGVVFPCDK